MHLIIFDIEKVKKNLCAGIEGHEWSGQNGRAGGHVEDESLLAFGHLAEDHNGHSSY